VSLKHLKILNLTQTIAGPRKRGARSNCYIWYYC